MNHPTLHAGALPATATRPYPRGGPSAIGLALVIFCVLAAAAFMAHESVEGAAPAATLSVIGETFDKGF
jgi:hypothetical protein